MGMTGRYIAEQDHVVNILPPESISGAASSDVFSMKNHSHVSIIVTAGSTDADAGNITIEECDDFTPTTDTEIAFTYYEETTAGGDTLSVKKTATASGGIDVSGNDDIMYVIEIDAAQLSDGFPNLQLKWSAPGGATLVSAVAVLSGSRYGGSETATVIA